MQSVSLIRLGVALLLLALATFLIVEYIGADDHKLKPGQQLLEEMMKLQNPIETSMLSVKAFEPSQISLRLGRYKEIGINIAVLRDGSIEGSTDDIHLILKPQKDGQIFRWTCSGSPTNRIPRGCQTP